MNKKIFLYFNDISVQYSQFNNFFVILSEYIVFIFLLLLLYYWLIKGKKKEDYRQVVLFAVYSAVLAIIINYLLSKIYFHDRPWILNLGRTIIPHEADASFPSDHTSFMLGIAVSFFVIPKFKKVGLILFFLGIISGVSRIICGLHFPLDILGSCIVSFVCYITLFVFKQKLIRINTFLLVFYKKNCEKIFLLKYFN